MKPRVSIFYVKHGPHLAPDWPVRLYALALRKPKVARFIEKGKCFSSPWCLLHASNLMLQWVNSGHEVLQVALVFLMMPIGSTGPVLEVCVREGPLEMPRPRSLVEIERKENNSEGDRKDERVDNLRCKRRCTSFAERAIQSKGETKRVNLPFHYCFSGGHV